MKIVRVFLVFCVLMLSGLAWGSADVTGTWQSQYDFGSVKEVMTADIQQVGENLLGSFSVDVKGDADYSGIVFGTIDGNKIKAYYLSVKKMGNDDSLVEVTFTDGKLVNSNTIQGTAYYQDSDRNAVPGFDYKATRI
ncbi:MAG: hypothetical protein ACXQT4_06160 [Methanotrichaceae archaeon]|mgnify:CR=1 FL=1